MLAILVYTFPVVGKLLLALALLLAFSFFVRIFRLSEPRDYYFDEVYHVVTARAYSQNNPDAYDPFAPAPEEDTAFDWLHPPLAKLIQAGSIKIIGDEPIGWRLPSAIFGTAIVGATYLAAFVLFGPVVAIFSAAVLAFENLNLVMSRITMNDVFVVFFIVVSFVFGHKYLSTNKFKHLLLTCLLLGLSVASKWTGAYAILAVGAYIFFGKMKERKVDFKLILLLAIPAAVYLLSYGQFWLQGHSVRQFIDLHKQIWWYQNRHDLEHSYGTTPLFCVPKGLEGPKTWCPWFLNSRGVYFSYEQYDQRAGYIYALGNPLIFWSGILAVSYLIGKYLDERKKEYLLILLGYFIFWVPWIFTPRLLFLYHYLPSIPFLAISIGLVLTSIWRTRFKYLSILILLIFAGAFFYFYPITSGFPIEPESIEKYMWLSTWR
ncbi:phospholipid carrier-dependent glycosyltransferase [Candidatus Curtissbacteria bacterium]|nr:phospholipid carrier-dependent glycosyltransferase [Candidatus Curtissbacteria bacterium]